MNERLGDAASHRHFFLGGLVVVKGAAARGSALRFHPLVGVIVGEATMQVEQTAAGRPAPLIPHQIRNVSIYVQYTQLVKLM